MMEVEYRREMNRNYMVIRPPVTGRDKYTVRMLNGNQIQGLLAFQDKMMDGDMKYYYDITSKQPLNRILEHRHMSGEELRTLVSELLYTLKQMERFFLDEGQLCFQPEYIYVEPNSFKASFCLIPGRRKEFAEELCELSQYLLDHVNQSDGEAVVLAFSIFKECRKLNFGIDDIERCLRQQETAQREGVETSVKEEKEIENDIFSAEKLRKEPEKAIGKQPEEKPKEKQVVRTEYTTNWIFKGKTIVLIILVILMAGFPVVLFLLNGLSGIVRWKWWIFAGELLGVFLISLLSLKLKEKDGQKFETNMGITTEYSDE